LRQKNKEDARKKQNKSETISLGGREIHRGEYTKGQVQKRAKSSGGVLGGGLGLFKKGHLAPVRGLEHT